MNDFITMQYQLGNITDDQLQLYLSAGMITQDFYNNLTKSSSNN